MTGPYVSEDIGNQELDDFPEDDMSAEFRIPALEEFGISGDESPQLMLPGESGEDILQRLEILERRLDSLPLPQANPFVFPAVTTGSNFTEVVSIGGTLALTGPRAGTFIALSGTQSIMVEVRSKATVDFVQISAATSNSYLGQITGVTSTVNATTWIYTVSIVGVGASTGYNQMEWNGTNSSIIQGSPGSLGVTVGTDGSVTGTSCFIRPIGNTGYIPFDQLIDGTTSQWIFTIPNSASA